MTAFNDIMLAEQEAEKEILSAKEESIALIASARSAHLNTLQAEDAAFATKAALAQKDQLAKIEKTIAAIQTKSESTVNTVKQKFAAKHKEVLTTLVSRFQ